MKRLPLPLAMAVGCLLFAGIYRETFPLPLYNDDYPRILFAANAPAGRLLGFWRVALDDIADTWHRHEAYRARLAGSGIDSLRLYWRPLPNLLTAGLHHLAGADPRPYRVAAIGAHLAVCLLLASFVVRLTGDRLAAGIASLLFMLTPAHFETIAWFSAIDDSLAAAGVLGVLGLLAGRRPAGDDRSGWPAGLAAVGCLTLALASKESALIVPLLGLLAVRLRQPGSSAASAGWLAALAAVGLLYGGLRFGLPPGPGEGTIEALHAGGLGGAAGTLGRFLHLGPRYLAHAVWLSPMLPPHPVPVTGWSLLLPAAAAAGGLTGAVLLAGPARRPALLAVGIFLIGLLPAVPVPPAQRYLYLPSLGLAMLAALPAARLLRGALQSLPPAVVLAPVALLLLPLLAGWRDEARRWSGMLDALTAPHTRAVAEVLERVPDMDDRRIYLIDVWWHLLMFRQSLELAAGRPVDLQILSFSPALLPAGLPPPPGGRFGLLVPPNRRFAAVPEGRLEMRLTDGRRLVLSLSAGDFFAGPAGWLTDLDQIRLPAGFRFDRGRYEVTITGTGAAGGPTDLEFLFAEPLDPARDIVLRWRPDGFETVFPPVGG